MRRRIYIAGPISRGDLRQNIQQADDAAAKLIAAGFAPIVPHWSCYYGGILPDYYANNDGVVMPRYDVTHGRGDGCHPVAAASATNAVPYEAWMEIDFSLISVCHALLRLPGESPGADREVAFARERGVAVFTDIDLLIAMRWNGNLGGTHAKQTDWSKVIGQWPGDETDDEVDKAIKGIE